MRNLAIIGAGDLGKQIAFHVETDRQFRCVGFLDDFAPLNSRVTNVPVIGNLYDVKRLYAQGIFDGLIIGIGYRHLDFRAKLFIELSDTVPFLSFVHSSSFVASNVTIGPGTVVFPRCIIDINTHVGSNTLIYTGCNISHDCTIENHAFLSPGIQMGGFCHLGSSCHLGIGTVVIDNLKLCAGTITGAGAVIVKNTEEPGLYLGCPAKLKRK